MTGTQTVFTDALHRVQRRHGKRFVAEAPTGPVQRPARVAVMLALAHKIDAAIVDGHVRDQAEVARRLGFTRARLTHLLNLRLLAPDIQDALLALEATDGVEPLTEHSLRAVTSVSSWTEQRRKWVCYRKAIPRLGGGPAETNRRLWA